MPASTPPTHSFVMRLRGASHREDHEVLLLASWFFVITAALWFLKPVRTAALLAHLGSGELPLTRLASVVIVGLVVLGYSRLVGRLSRLAVTVGASVLFALAVGSLWLALVLGSEALGQRRWFVWTVFCLVDAYATVMVAIFWTFANDVVSRAEADRLYAPIGIGGILGGIAGGAATDGLAGWVGPTHLLLPCAGLILAGGGLAYAAERVLRPPLRAMAAKPRPPLSEALEGARAVFRKRYLLWMVGVVIAYESAAALTDYAVNVIFERAFESQTELAKMFGRLGWIVGATALAAQLVLVPRLLPAKRAALLLPPLLMAAATLSLALLPTVALAIALAASDRGLNYSLQQVTRETLYFPLSDLERHKAKAFIDMFVDRAAKALASLSLVVVMLATGTSPTVALLLAMCALVFWLRCASNLGKEYERLVVERKGEAAPARPDDARCVAAESADT